jgi:hypothetical protein
MGFLNPLFLIGGLAVAVPVLLHMIRREQARKVEFPTLMFLRKIDKRTVRYQKLRHLLLLLLRICAFLLLVLAFMRPFRKEAPVSAAVTGKTARTHIIALDTSMSMRYQDRWERARDAAADIVENSDAGDRFAVLDFSGGTVIRTQLLSDRRAVLDAIENIPEPGNGPTRYAQALRAAETVARESGMGKCIIHVISDFQKNGWTDKEREFELDPDMEVRTVDLGSDTFSNLAIRDVRSIEEDAGGAADLRVQASVVEFGVEDRKNVRVGLTVDGRKLGEKSVSVAKQSSREIEFPIPELKPGDHSVVLETDDPYFEPDNRFYMTVEVRAKTPVTLIENPESRSRRTPGFFLARALNAGRLSPYEVKVASPPGQDISGRLLIWNDLPAGDSAIQKRIEDFVRSGGGMIIVLGGSTRAPEFNRGFGTWLPVKMEEASSDQGRPDASPADSFVMMTDLQAGHPIFKPFSRPHSGSFTSARFYKHACIAAGPGAETLARFDNGDIALLSIGLDKGRVLIFTSSADDSGNDLPRHAVYAPFWQQMLRWLEHFEEQRSWMEVGDVIDPERILSRKAFRLGQETPDGRGAVAMLDPAKQRLEIAPGSSGIVAEKSGFYDIRSIGLNTAVAVNPAAAESDLTHTNAEEMAAAWKSSGSGKAAGGDIFNSREKDKNGRIWIFLFLAALLLLISESLLSGSRPGSESDTNRDITA